MTLSTCDVHTAVINGPEVQEVLLARARHGVRLVSQTDRQGRGAASLTFAFDHTDTHIHA